VSDKSSRNLVFVVNVVNLDVKILIPPFFLTFEICNYNIHNFLVDLSAFVNVILLSVAKKINAKWDQTDAQII